MNRSIAIDLTRLFLGLCRAVPRGIDRVEFGYARHLLERWPGDCDAVLPTPWGVRLFERAHALKTVDLAERLWRESRPADDEPVYREITAWLAGHGPKPSTRSPRKSAPIGRVARVARQVLTDVGLAAGKPVRRAVPPGAAYVNVGQTGLAASPLLAWLARRPDVKPVFMLHDAIPLEHPEFVPGVEVRYFEKILANTARHAAGLVTSTAAAERAIRTQLQHRGRGDVPAVVISLPVAESFLAHDQPDPELQGVCYFVTCGSIEPRKNHLLLLNIWRELACEHGPATPKLLLIGSRWRPQEPLIELLEHCGNLRPHIFEIAGLSTPALRRLLRNARGLLMPSFAEGFGMPIVEALTVGAPVIASDLPAHREAGGGFATYLGTTDSAGWRAAIEAHASATQTPAQLASYQPWLWTDYFAKLTPFLESI
jgi:glycosyltransferase involved in cell wall biosynthesis